LSFALIRLMPTLHHLRDFFSQKATHGSVLAAAFVARATLASLATAIEAAFVALPFALGASLSTAKLPLRLSLH
jgi:hypothetical protein